MGTLFFRNETSGSAGGVWRTTLPISDHFDGKTFHNSAGGSKKSLDDLLQWRRTRQPVPWPAWRDLPLVRPPRQVDEDELLVTFVGHATFLLQFHDLTVLTDPHWSRRASPFGFLGPKRVHPPAISFNDLPKIDLVLLSHNHYDHCDIPTLRRLYRRDNPRLVVPVGDGKRMHRAGLSGIREVDWWQEVVIAAGVRLIFTPAQHWSSRNMRDYNRSLWGGYLLQTPGNLLYFAGDTGYGPHFAQIAERYGPVDQAFLPIGAYEPRWFMRPHHMNPAEALSAHRALKARHSIGMHFGCFQLSDEGIDQPLEDLAAALREQDVSEAEFSARPAGSTWRWPLGASRG